MPGAEAFLRAVSAKMPVFLVTNGIAVVQRGRFEQSELRGYIRDEKGRVVKTDDHGCDAMRYLCMSGKDVAKYPQQAQAQRKFQQPSWVA